MAHTTMTSGNLQSFLRLLDDKRMTDARFTKILANGVLADVFDENADLSDRAAVRVALKLEAPAPLVRLATLPEVFRLTVDYGLSLEEMIVAGHYDWWSNDITAELFPVTGTGVVEFEARLFQFDCDIASDDAKRRIEAADPGKPWAVAKIEHLLAFGTTFADEQRKHPIVAPGSVAKVYGHRYVPYLYRDYANRYLNLGWFARDWNPICRFLAVRRVSVA